MRQRLFMSAVKSVPLFRQLDADGLLAVLDAVEVKVYSVGLFLGRVVFFGFGGLVPGPGILLCSALIFWHFAAFSRE